MLVTDESLCSPVTEIENQHLLDKGFAKRSKKRGTLNIEELSLSLHKILGMAENCQKFQYWQQFVNQIFGNGNPSRNMTIF